MTQHTSVMKSDIGLKSFSKEGGDLVRICAKHTAFETFLIQIYAKNLFVGVLILSSWSIKT